MNYLQRFVSQIIVVTVMAFTFSCVHELTPTCTGVHIDVTYVKTDATTGQANGTIIGTAAGESTYFTYSLNKRPFQAANLFAGLDSGTYTLTARNSWGCTSSVDIRVAKVDPCAGVTLSGLATNASPGKTDGSIAAVMNNATGYSFTINNGTFQSSNLFNGLASGNYILTAKNDAGCLFSTNVAVTASSPCAGVVVVVTSTSVAPAAGQSNGSITVSAIGATGFTYSLNAGAYQSSNVFNGLAAGNYVVAAKSSAGCLGTATVTLGTTNLCAGVTIAVSLSSTAAGLNVSNGTITATATGGASYTYSLNNGAYQSSNVFSGLAAGSYSVIAKTADGCLGSASTIVASNDPCANTTITATTATTSSDNCGTVGTGSITVTASGSTGFTYSLSGGAFQSSNVFSAVLPGTYTITVKDVNQCTKTASATVGSSAAGPLFTALKALVQSRCSGSSCHTNGKSQKGYNFDADCSIVGDWSGIYNTTISGKLTKMPISPQANLTAAEKLVITNWYNAGHTFAN